MVNATIDLQFEPRKVEANDIGRLKKLMATDTDVLHVHFEGPVGLVGAYPSQILKLSTEAFFAVGDWVKVTGDMDGETGMVKKGSIGMVIFTKSNAHLFQCTTEVDWDNGELVTDWSEGGVLSCQDSV